MIRADRFLLRAAALAGAVLALAVATPAEPVELPVERPLETEAVWITLHAGRVRIRFSAEAAPHVSIRDAEHGDATTGFVILEEREKWLEIVQPHGDERTAPPLAVELTLVRGMSVVLRGSDAEVLVEGEAGSPGVEPAERSPAGPAAMPVRFDFDVDMDRASVLLRGVRSARIRGRDTNVRIEDGAGALALEQEAGEAVIEDRRGTVRVDGEEPSYRFERFDGHVEGRIQGGMVSLENSVASLRLTATDGEVFLQGWHGSGHLDGEAMHVEVHDSGGGSDRLDVGGSEIDLEVDGYAGRLAARLEGGTQTADRLGGALTLRLSDGAFADVRRLSDALEADLQGGSHLGVEQAERRIEATVVESRVELDAIRDARVKLKRSELIGTGVTGRIQLDAVGADVDLDLSESRAQSSLSLKGATRARVQMRQPCFVLPTGGKQARERIETTGCTLGGAARRPRPGGGAPVFLQVTVGAGAELEVDGLP